MFESNLIQLVSVIAIIILVIVIQIKQQLDNIVENGISCSSEMQITDDDLRNIIDLVLEELGKKKPHERNESDDI